MGKEDKPARGFAPVGNIGPGGNVVQLAKMTRYNDRNLPFDMGLGQNLSHGIREITPAEADLSADRRQRPRSPARGILLALAIGVFMWIAGFYLFETFV